MIVIGRARDFLSSLNPSATTAVVVGGVGVAGDGAGGGGEGRQRDDEHVTDDCDARLSE